MGGARRCDGKHRTSGVRVRCVEIVADWEWRCHAFQGAGGMVCRVVLGLAFTKAQALLFVQISLASFGVRRSRCSRLMIMTAVRS